MQQPLETHADVLVRIGMMAIPGASHVFGAPVPVDHAFGDQLDNMATTVGGGHDATGMAAANLAEGGTVINGPAAGGAFLDRPAGDFLAHASDMQALDISVPHHGVAEAIKSIEGYSHLNVGGLDIDLMDYVPGGDIVQIMSGQAADPSSLSMMIAKNGFSHEVGTQAEISRGPGLLDGPTFEAPGEQASPDAGFGEAVGAGTEKDADTFGIGEAGVAAAEGAGAHAAARRIAKGASPDSDVLERDRGMLLEEHALNLETSVGSFDQSVVHTEMHAHGRTLAVDTHFEAHHPNNEFEKHVADDHVHDEVLHAPRDETTTERPAMTFRTLVHAHLDAAAQDEGMSI